MTDEAILATLRRTILTVVPDIEPAGIEAGRTLAELGCNSIDRAEIVTLAMEELGIVVPVYELRSGIDLRGLVDIMGRYA
jgi:polyketide biosynthesis acyl carrier protein